MKLILSASVTRSPAINYPIMMPRFRMSGTNDRSPKVCDFDYPSVPEQIFRFHVEMCDESLMKKTKSIGCSTKNFEQGDFVQRSKVIC